MTVTVKPSNSGMPVQIFVLVAPQPGSNVEIHLGTTKVPFSDWNLPFVIFPFYQFPVPILMQKTLGLIRGSDYL